ncbi:MAG: hypothetical protein JXO72_11820 [Vicinamibacteria bacterium]|nr:hypothetical protein [Vicinamibacteria bacterium]
MLELILFLAVTTNAIADARVKTAERLAEQARLRCMREPDEGLAALERAMAMTADFSPTHFVNPGRKGELVDDDFLAARAGYRVHRAGLYGAMGECLSYARRDAAAARYLRRALDLDPRSERGLLGETLLRLDRAREALSLVLDAHAPSPRDLLVAGSAADALGLASVQAEIDRARIMRLSMPSVAYRAGPFRLPPTARLSTGAPFRLVGEHGVTLVYVSEASGRHCSADLEQIDRAARLQDSRIVLLPADTEADQVLRRAVRLYSYDWPVALGPGLAAAFDVVPACAVIVGRDGFSGVVVRSPLDETLASVLEIFAREDVQEKRPRRAWSGGRPDDASPAARPGLLAEGLAPGEDEPFPAEFTQAVAAFRAGRYDEAIRLFESLAQLADGWLLLPEERFNRALCLRASGARAEARRMLLKIGDSRFQEAVDRALEDCS